MLRINIHNPPLRKAHPLVVQALYQLLTFFLHTCPVSRRYVHRKIRCSLVLVLTLIFQATFGLLVYPQEYHLRLILRTIIPLNVLLLRNIISILSHNRFHIIVFEEVQFPAYLWLIGFVDKRLEVVAD